MLLLALAAHAAEPVPEPAAPDGVLLAIFEEAPPEATRQKVVRLAMRRSRSIVGGRDWGRVLCFRFDGPLERDGVQWAADKVSLKADLREGPTCDEPPPDALFDRAPTAWRRVVFDPSISVELAQRALAPLLKLDLGVLAVKVSPAVAGRACLELSEPANPDALAFALQSVPFPVETSPAVGCGDALQGDP